ncbi:MAG: hypothetical protein OEY74_06185 [Gammaproteobacteria bacterium]|nr:hypothetical protein [Gammaproteobacteria bacterium]
MNINKPVFLMALCVTLASCASSTAIDTDAVAATDNEGLICRKEPTVGSRLGHTICTTRAEREEAARITREQHRTRSRTGVADGEISSADR